MDTSLYLSLPNGYTDSNITPLMINNLSGLDMIDILKSTKLFPSIPDTNPSLNTHVDLINSHIIYFEDTGFYQPYVWQFIIYPMTVNCLLHYIMSKTTL